MVEEFPWHLWQAGDSRRLEGALSDLDLSAAIWDSNQFDLYTFWAFLEGSNGFRKEITYKIVIQEPGKYQGHLFWVSELFYRTGVLDDSLKILETQATLYRESGNIDNLQKSLGNQALIHYDRGDLDEAMKLYKEEERICRELGNKDSLQKSLGNQGLIHHDWGDLDEAMKLYKEKERICREIGKKDSVSISLGNQANIHYAWGNLDEAMRLHKDKERICRELRNPSGLAYSFWSQALVWHEGYHKPKAALPLAKDALKLFKEVGMKPQARAVEELVARIEREM